MLDIDLTEVARRETPFYYYDLGLLARTVESVRRCAAVNDKFRVHYAVKACYDPRVLSLIAAAGLGADTVSGNEIAECLRRGFPADRIMFAGVGKTDREIDLALTADIEAFNVESLPELAVISERATALGKTARVALRINPDIDAHTHHFITTGLAENKFGINMSALDAAVDTALSLPSIELTGLHFHIGSQITVNEPYGVLCERVNNLLRHLYDRGVRLHSVNMGGGLGIDYDDPDGHDMPDFKAYFDTFDRLLDTTLVDEVHFELGRAIVGQCGSLITRILYVKEGDTRTFAILDAGMTELIRPALYGASHPIQNLTGEGRPAVEVDVVGPVCETTDTFATGYIMPQPERGDIVAIRSAGAYGEAMSSYYNMRRLNPAMYGGI